MVLAAEDTKQMMTMMSMLRLAVYKRYEVVMGTITA